MKKLAVVGFLVLAALLAGPATIFAQAPSPRPLPADLLFVGRSAITHDNRYFDGVFVVDANTMRASKILEAPEGTIDGAFWSPDGQYIAVIHGRGSFEGICVYHPDGEEVRCWELNDLVPWRDFLFWEDSRVVVITSRESGYEFVELDVSTGDVSRSPFDVGEALSLVQLSPTGDYLAYQTVLTESDSSVILGDKLYIYNRDQMSKKLVTSTSTGQCFSWSPDGQKLAVRQYGDTSFAFFDLEGVKIGEIHPQFEGKDISGCPVAWSHDGTRLAFNSLYREDPRTLGLFVTDIDEQKTYLLVDSFYTSVSITWSPDDSCIVTDEVHGGGWGQIVVASMDGWEKWYHVESGRFLGPSWRPG
ncbi:TolB family protein [Aggregatilinea lenta]|uniref:TolB family protein n=1 Tax=Aggregatilinea lenta TaxID=913108 RepID=UPI000E5A1765|nr:PD40 domain-containing protein [Aggregatilinea lenta]